MDFIDVAIIGGGPAGLTAANTLARQLHTAVVFDSKSYRNAGAGHMHMILTWDHKSPEEYRNAARKNILENYSTIQFADVAVAQVTKKGATHFEVVDADGKTWNFRKVILAVGSANIYPNIEGYEQLWKKRIFHCLFCHGYEDRGDGSSGVLAVAPVGAAVAVHLAQNAAQLTGQTTIYTNGNDELLGELKPLVSTLVESKFKIETREIKRLIPKDQFRSVSVEFADGSSKEEKFLVHSPQTSPQGPFVEQLGLTTTASGDIEVEGPFWQTKVPGVFAVGDCSTPYKVIPSAITSGCNAGVMASAEIQAANFSQS
ncbi:FAD/NAD(P)-binding domain-containing protein [Daldinia eschscholtzii]|nr:FAD/NAD(P)-binding domain-containing protein [Daldinia eschscholtzii]